MQVLNAAKLIIVSDGDFLVLRSSDTHPRWPLYQDFPGGIVENGELTEEGMVREVSEEAGITIDPRRVKLLYAEAEVIRDSLIYINHIFSISLSVKPEVTLSWEHDKFAWLNPKDVTQLAPAYQVGFDFIMTNKLI